MKKHVAMLATIAGLALASSAYAQYGTGPNEVEGNDSKSAADTNQGTWNLPGANASGVVVGTSTASSGAGIDTYHLRTAAASGGIYRHRMVITSNIAGHTGSIRGVNQVGAAAGVWDGSTVGTPGTTDSAAQSTSSATTPARFNQWYTFGPAADLYYRVTGSSTTTAPYSINYEVSTVAPIPGPTFANPGSITITTMGQGHSTDTDMWVYDANFNPILGYGNDDESVNGGGGGTTLQGIFTRNYAAGIYYLAISNYNVCNNMGSPNDDDYRTGTMLDFGGMALNSSTSAGLNLAVSIGGIAVPNTKVGAYDINFIQFEVLPTPGAAALMGLAGLAGLRRRR